MRTCPDFPYIELAGGRQACRERPGKDGGREQGEGGREHEEGEIGRKQ